MRVALFEHEGTLDAQEQILRERVERSRKGWTRQAADDLKRLERVRDEKVRRAQRRGR